MNKSLLCVAALMLGACATSDAEKATSAGANTAPSKLGVVQVGTQQNAEHVFCDSGNCPQRTPKYLPQPAAKPQVKAEASKPVQTHFKVHFRWGWSQLDSEGRKEVEAVASSGVLKNAKRVEIAGRTDPTGSRKYNEKLAIRRAETVKAALVLAGVPAEVITAAAQQPCCDGDKNAAPAAMRELRRTDIDITITTK